MSKPIGRVWINRNCVSGYIVIGMNNCIKFAFENKANGQAWIFASKEKDEENNNKVVENNYLNEMALGISA